MEDMVVKLGGGHAGGSTRRVPDSGQHRSIAHFESDKRVGLLDSLASTE
jgi:hypothetical protein